jgi:phage terminase large subunit-like protein
MSTLAAILAALPDAERRKALASLPASDLAALEYCWPVWARPDQLPPPPLQDNVTGAAAWRTWLLLGGRGSGKTRSSAEATRAEIESGRRMSIGLIGPTADTLRRDQAKSLMEIAPPWCMPVHEASQRRLVWPNGAIAYMLSSEEPDRIRGLNLDWAWGDELTSWANQADTWSNLQLALRVPGPKGDDPAAVISTTPKRQPLLKTIMAARSTVTTRSRTFDNAANLSAATIEHLKATYGGTSLGRQELDAELLDELEGALWNRAMLDACRVHVAPEPLRRVVVAIDPAGGASKTSDETGIVAAGRGADGHGYVLADISGRYSPDGWARRAVELYRNLRADRIVAEANFGGGMVEATIRSVDPSVPVKLVHASRGKAVRAEPVVSFYEQRRVHHVGVFHQMEDQLCGWDPMENGPSPDRLDALVWAISELMVEPQAQPARFLRVDIFGR